MIVSIKPQAVTASANPAQESVVINPQTVVVESIPDPVEISTGLPIIRELVGGEPYEGSYSVTPTTETQELPTSGKLLARDITVDPIPSNYGLITWSGSILTVS